MKFRTLKHRFYLTLKKQLTYFFLVITFVCLAQNRQQQLDSLLHLTKTTADSTKKASAHSRLAWLYLNNNVPIAEAHLDTSMVLYTALKDEDGVAESNYKYAVLNRVLGEYKDAHEYIDKYLVYAETLKDTFKIANALFQKGVVSSLQVDYQSSLEQYHKTLGFYESLKDSTGMGFTLNSIGIVYKNLKNYGKAIESYKQAEAIHLKKNDLNNLANVYNGLGSVYSEQKNYEKALDYFNQVLTIDEQIGNNWGIAKVSKNIGLIHVERQNYSKALEYFNKAHKIQKEYEFTSEIAETLTQLSTVYMKLGDYKKSEDILKQAFEYNIPSKKVYKDMHLQSYELYENIGNSKLALFHHKKYITYKDSVFNDNNLKNINALQIQFETEKKEKEIIAQELQLNKQEEAYQKKQVQYNYMTGIAIFLLLTSILIFFVFNQRQKRKTQEILTLKREHQIKTLEALIEGEENERFRIAKELHDGVNGDLSAIKYKLSSLMEMNNKVIKEAIAMIDDSCKQVRAISHDLVPPSLENFNLVEATEVYCNNLNETHSSTEIVFQYLGDAIAVSKKVEINMFRIIQELVTNSLKHAEATVVNVQISNRNAHIQITVEDNGIGFNKDEVTSKGIGLGNVQSRVEYLNASIDLISNENGTSYTIDIDVDQLHDN